MNVLAYFLRLEIALPYLLVLQQLLWFPSLLCNPSMYYIHNKYVSVFITVITQTWLHYDCFKRDLTIWGLCSTWRCYFLKSEIGVANPEILTFNSKLNFEIQVLFFLDLPKSILSLELLGYFCNSYFWNCTN